MSCTAQGHGGVTSAELTAWGLTFGLLVEVSMIVARGLACTDLPSICCTTVFSSERWRRTCKHAHRAHVGSNNEKVHCLSVHRP